LEFNNFSLQLFVKKLKQAQLVHISGIIQINFEGRNSDKGVSVSLLNQFSSHYIIWKYLYRKFWNSVLLRRAYYVKDLLDS
uniref:Maturase K n=1 Tax=Brugia timori TaxID=42155 RepID=A0A0R3Q8Q0_9BILA